MPPTGPVASLSSPPEAPPGAPLRLLYSFLRAFGTGLRTLSSGRSSSVRVSRCCSNEMGCRCCVHLDLGELTSPNNNLAHPHDQAYSPECVDGGFRELCQYRVLRALWVGFPTKLGPFFPARYTSAV